MSQMGVNVPASVRMLFTLGQGKSRLVAEPQARGFSVVKVNRIVPGNALSQPALIGRVQNDFQSALADEYTRQFLNAVRQAAGVKRNEEAIAATRKRISS
jgi:peptidyl-prolyl cis-trans isomerase D